MERVVRMNEEGQAVLKIATTAVATEIEASRRVRKCIITLSIAATDCRSILYRKVYCHAFKMHEGSLKVIQ